MGKNIIALIIISIIPLVIVFAIIMIGIIANIADKYTFAIFRNGYSILFLDFAAL